MPKPPHPGRAGHKLTFGNVSAQDALAAALKVKLSDVKKLEGQQSSEKPAQKRKRKK
jgi:hypothetical protein